MIRKADIVIVGAGVHGCGLAFHLTAAGAGSVAVLEKGCVASGPTGQSGAMIRPLFDQRLYVELVIASTRMFEQWDQIVGGDAGFVQQGFLRITNSLDTTAIGGDLEITRTFGEPVEILDPSQMTELVPMACFRDDEIGILFPRGGYADPYQTTVDLAAAAVRQGAEILEETEVTGLRTKSGRITGVMTGTGEIATSVVVNCAGPWSGRIAQMAGVSLPIEPQAAPTCLFRRPREMLTVGPVLSDGVHQVYLRAMGDTVYRAAHFGRAEQTLDPDEYDRSVPWAQQQMLREGVAQRYDAMRRAPCLGGFTAVYDMSPDGHPLVGAVDAVEGFWSDCGWSGNGFAPAPAATRSLAARILGQQSEVSLAPFGWPRTSDLGSRLYPDWVHQ
ncbi:MAG: FAD-binding oxidoreductase [Planctomycetota bacterium]|nr:FAD-binding oxidoreductase [Planctomycetota bacterium]